MSDILKLEKQIKEMIDELKGICSSNGLSNQAGEETVITSMFLYKFLNDKFMYNIKMFAKDMGRDQKDVLDNKENLLDAFYNTYSDNVSFSYEDTIEYMVNKITQDDFYKVFDDALIRISNYEKNEVFGIETATGSRKPLFTRITEIVDIGNRNAFAKALFGVISQEKFDFEDAFVNSFDFYSTIFEYLIKDYNVASGTYAEYFTPQAVSKIIAKILFGISTNKKDIYEICDPSAGSGSLVLHLANELGSGKLGNKARVFTQDISNKSTRFLRINMLLNGLTESLDNIIEGDTMLSPSHFEIKHDASSGLKKFDFIVSNPPFKVDFSSIRNDIESKWSNTDRFFAGVPKIPNKKKESMAIYLLFIQHILHSLKDDGLAAIVVPTGFITAQSGIEKTIRQKLIDKKWLRGVVSMPSNIFANTGTNVSVLFIDKSIKPTIDEEGNEIYPKVLLMDASNLGEKVKDGKNQKTVLSAEETEKIINTFINGEVIEDFSVAVTYDEIIEKNYSFSAGQYFEVKIEYVDISQEEYDKMIDDFNNDFAIFMKESAEFQKNIKEQLNGLKVKKNKE